MSDKFVFLKTERVKLRSEWQSIRDIKLSRKRELLQQGMNIEEIRHDRLYRQYKKSQHIASKQIKHLEIKINRYISRNRVNVI